MDLPTYTNIWRIEKRLYKLYDFRLPAPLPITWIAVFAGITVPYVVFLVAIGLPFNHNLVWLYVLPPGLLTWLTTRPVIENKRLPELVSSQLRYVSEPRTWCRMAPFAEKDQIALSARVWHRSPAQARAGKSRTEKAAKSRGPARLRETTRPAPARPAGRAAAPVPVPVPAASTAQVAVPVTAEPAAARSTPPMTPMTPVSTPAPAPERAVTPVPVPQRATASTGASSTTAGRPWPGQAEPDAPAGDPGSEDARQSAWPVPSAERRQDSRALEVSHDSGPDLRDPGPPVPAVLADGLPPGPPAWPPPTGSFSIPAAAPEPVTFPEAGPFPEVGAFPEVSAFPEATAFPEMTACPGPGPEPAVGPETGPVRDPVAAAAPAPAPVDSAPVPAATPAAGRPGRSVAARVAALFVDLEGDRPLPSVERALSGPGSSADASWSRRVKVVTGGQGPGQRDLQTLDRDRARLPLAGPSLIVVLGCTSGAGQSTVAMMTGLILAAIREAPVAALDLNPGGTSLAARVAPAASVAALLAGEIPDPAGRTDSGTRPPRGDWRARSARGPSGARLDVIGDRPGTAGHVLDGHDYQRLASALAAQYPLTMIDPAPSRLARALSVADQLVLVAPVTPDAAGALANTQQWLSAHGYGEAAARSVTVINGVGRRPSEDVLRAEAAAKRRCRAIVRVPIDDQLPVHLDGLSSLHPQTRLAYTALAGVIVSGLAAGREAAVPGRSPGEHSH
ncbi:MAG TPA: TcpE family conjugal transfer membrane protein [Streptosporangiaceae bacterium]|nr:TcpE family conjugal transfer membrane protein [Streptosporangiaceae bacterium]